MFVLHAAAAVLRLDPDPAAAGVEYHLEHLLVAADVDDGVQLDVVEVVQVLLDVVVVLLVGLRAVVVILVHP